MPAAQQSLFKALADPTRRAILKSLQKGSLTAGEIADSYSMSRASLSHHFNVLKAADLVRTERRGQHIVYSLNATVAQEAAVLLFELFSPSAGPDEGGRDKRKPSKRQTK